MSGPASETRHVVIVKPIAALLARTDQSKADADTARGARLVEYSRRADLLASRRTSMTPAAYGRAQGELFALAEAVVR